MKQYGGVEVKLHAFLTVILDGGGQLDVPTVLPSRKELPIPIG
jgi:hypothetical protein